MFPTLTFIIELSLFDNEAIMTVSPFYFASLYSAFTLYFYLMNPSTMVSLYRAYNFVKANVGSTGTA